MAVELEPIKLKKSVVALVRDNKKKTKVPMAAFVEEAIIEKLKRETGKKK